MTNPIAGLVPDISIFGAEFTTWWQKLFVGGWALLIVIAIGALAMSLGRLHKATTNNIPGQADEAKSHAGWAAAALGALCGLGVIVTAIFSVTG